MSEVGRSYIHEYGVFRSDVERRTHPRVAVHAAAMVLVRHNAGVALTIESVSLGGARLVGEITLVVGERVQVLFEIDGHPLDVRGEVVRSEKLDMATDRVAVRFVDLAEDAKQVLRRVVDQLFRP